MPVNFTLSPKPQSDRGDVSFSSLFFNPETARSLLVAAEDAGFGGVIIDDPAGLLGNLDLSSYAASKTEALAVIVTHWAGVMSPEAAARQIASINNVANGRLSIRVTVEESAGDRQPAGTQDHSSRQRRTDEYLMLLKRLWSSERPFDYEGPFYSVRDGYVSAKGAFGPAIPIRMSGRSGVALSVAGRHADVFELEGGSLFDIRTMMRRVVAAATPFGRGSGIRFALPVAVLGEEAAPAVVEHPACTIRLGDPSRVALALLPFIEAGVTEFLISGLADRASIRRFGQQVIPLVRNSALHLRGGDGIGMALPPEPLQTATLRWRSSARRTG